MPGTTNCAYCMDHSGCVARMDAREIDDTKQWEAIDGIRVDIKGLFLKIGILVGTLQTISTVAIAIIVHYATK